MRGPLALIAELAGDAPAWAARAQRAAAQVGRTTAPARDRLIIAVGTPALPLPARVAAYQAVLALEAAADPDAALRVGEQLLAQVAGSALAHLALAGLYRWRWAITRPRELIAQARALGGHVGARVERRLDDQARWLARGLPLSPPVARSTDGAPGRVLYVVASSRPYHSAGYAARTHALVGALRRRGWDVQVAARAGYPSDRWDYPGWALPPRRLDVDGVPHHFAPTRAKLRYAREPEAYHHEAADALEALCRQVRPALLHAASNYNVGLATVEVGRRLGLPVVYEVRGLWHVSKAATSAGYDGSDHYRLIARLEAQAAAAADHTFAITSGVAAELVAGGAEAARVSLLGNAADVAALQPQPPDAELVRRHHLAGQVVLGYVGTLSAYEGLDALLVAAARLHAAGAPVRVLIVGDGAAAGPLRAQAAELGLGHVVTFTGRVGAADVRRYYSVIDLLVLPRRPDRVCELVSPLKPFEAMALGCPVVASDVAALADLVVDGVTGRLFRKGDVGALTALLTELIADPAQRTRLGQAAAAWVRRDRSWDALAVDVDAVWRRLGA